jgi:hypothetical protein
MVRAGRIACLIRADGSFTDDEIASLRGGPKLIEEPGTKAATLAAAERGMRLRVIS